MLEWDIYHIIQSTYVAKEKLDKCYTFLIQNATRCSDLSKIIPDEARAMLRVSNVFEFKVHTLLLMTVNMQWKCI